MNKLEIKENILNLKDELNSIISNGEAEKRELNDEETSKMAELRNKIDEFESQLSSLELEERKLNNTNTNTQKKMIKLTQMINNIVVGNEMTDEQREFINAGNSEFRNAGLTPKGQIQLRNTLVAGVKADGGFDVATELLPLETAVRNNLVIAKMGADILSGLKGDIQIPTYSGSEVKWKGEVAAADDGAGAFGEVTLSPKRLTAKIDVSKQLLIQSSDDIERMIINDLAAAIAEKIDETAFSNQTGTTDMPAGIMTTANTTTGTALTAMTYENVLALEEGNELVNNHNYMFIVNPKVKFALKGTQLGNCLNFVWQNNEIDGYKAISSNSVQEKAIVCMNPKALVVGLWGIEIAVNPYIKMDEGTVEIVANAYVDFKLRNDQIKAEIFS